MSTPWSPQQTLKYVDSQYDPATGGYRSVPGGPATLYGTVYGLFTKYFLGVDPELSPQTREFLTAYQDEETGYFLGPELTTWSPPAGAMHSREHLMMHLTCTTLPAMAQFGLKPRRPLSAARRFVEIPYLLDWLDQRDLGNAWFEGNNILFVGQLLVYLRDVEKIAGAQAALDAWFKWLDDRIDPKTGLWGTDRGATLAGAMYGGYHQLLVYYHERRIPPHAERLVDSTLSLQHADGGFSQHGGGGACEDADGVDILVNLYKLIDYRRADIRDALRRCARCIMAIQNPDGGFPYRKGARYDHMGMPATVTTPGGSGMFMTWFRVHTLALISEIVPDEPGQDTVPFRFATQLSMGWHRPWDKHSKRYP
jgi:hypothetical protein